MFPTGRASLQTRSSYHTPIHALRLRERLRQSGAIASSRSALSRHDATSEDFLVVDVGEGRTPTATEQLIARFEQHGLRRCYLADADVGDYTVASWVDLTKDVTGSACTSETASRAREDEPCADTHGEDRAPYYYLCVPCEQRLTNISASPATVAMLQDLHYHFASAAHREAASWMADPDIDQTLATSACTDDPRAYTRVHLNGIPLLLSRRPGGGDMFYPLPHEVERVRLVSVVRRAPVPREITPGSTLTEERPEHGLLFPSPRYSSDANYWYRPLTAVDTQCKQLLSLPPRRSRTPGGRTRGSGVGQTVVRRTAVVHHVPVDDYLRQTRLEKDAVTVHPCLFALERRMLPKAAVAAATVKRGRGDDADAGGPPVSTDSRRCFYVQPSRPYLTRASSRSGDTAHTVSPLDDRCLVEANGVYRVCVRSTRAGAVVQPSLQRPLTANADGTPALTRELLSQVTSCMPFAPYHTVGTSVGSHGRWLSSRSSGGDFSEAESSGAREDGGGPHLGKERRERGGLPSLPASSHNSNRLADSLSGGSSDEYTSGSSLS